MKKRILKLLLMGSVYSMIGLLAQIALINMASASDLVAQPAKSVKDVTVRVDFSGLKLLDAFHSIEEQTDFQFVFDKKDRYLSKTIDLHRKRASVEQVLLEISRQAGLAFRQVNRNISVEKKKPGVAQLEINLQAIKITGKVTSSEDKEGLPGANVIVKGTTQGTVTDIDGNYSIDVPSGESTLVFSSVGYQQEEVTVGNKTVINVVMSPDIKALQEIVVVGYGVTKKKDLTGSVASVKGKDFQNVPTSRVDQVLQGRAPGVQVTQNNGAPGTGSTIRIRGGNSIQGDNQPLYVVDGFIVGTDFNLNDINVNDIESIDILKDATSISIYGTRGANGVILITTKSGKNEASGKPKITLNAYSGTQKLKSTIDLANGPELALLSNIDAENRGAALPFPDLNQVPNTNWIDQITHTAPMTNIDVSVSGNSNDHFINYYISGNYFDQDGIVRGSGIKKYIFRSNMDIKLSQKLSVGVRLNITSLKKENNKVNLSSMWIDGGLTAKAVYNEDGTFTATNPVTGSVQRNAEADIELRTDHDFVTNILGNAYIQFEPIKGLVLKSSIGPQINLYKNDFYLPGILPERLATLSGGYARISSNRSVDILNENTLTYNKDFATNHHVDVLAGFTWQTYNEESYRAEAEGFTNDVVRFNNLGLGDPTRNVVTSGYTGYQLVSWLGRMNYSFKDKYLVTFVGRVDGSSRFSGSNNQYGFFPSAALAWRLSEEPWIQNLGIFDNLKLRTSYGLSGSQAIGSYRTLATLDPISMFFNATEQPGVRNGRPASPDLKWETTKQFDVGLESSYFKGRLSVEIDYYHKITDDLLLNVEIPRQTGFSTKLQNLGSIQNQGLEFLIKSVNVDHKDFSWETTLSLAGNRSEVLNIGQSEYLNIAGPTNQGGTGGRLYVGEPVPVFVGVEYLGVWKSQEEIDASGIQNQSVGGPHFKDTNGDGVISESDFEILGSPEPEFYGGIMNSFRYKNFNLDIFFNGSYGNDLFNSVTQQAFFFREGSNSYKSLLNYWDPETRPNSNEPVPGTSLSLANIKNNSQEIENGSYLRLKSVRLSYGIPQKILQNVSWIKNLMCISLERI